MWVCHTLCTCNSLKLIFSSAGLCDFRQFFLLYGIPSPKNFTKLKLPPVQGLACNLLYKQSLYYHSDDNTHTTSSWNTGSTCVYILNSIVNARFDL